jgi:hypothetical protein
MMAYFRSFSDIPYALDASKALRGEEAARQIYEDDFNLVTRFAGPFAEARYKSLNRFVSSQSNVLELAVGTSVERGLVISDDPTRLYIGTDLPEIIMESKAFLKSIDEKCGRTNHYMEAANVVCCDELNAAASHIGARRGVGVINEGLLTYLTGEEQAGCAENVRTILARYGGKWVTPDITDVESNTQFVSSLGPEVEGAIRRGYQRIASLTGRDVERNYFENRKAAIGFFQKAGFKVKLYPMVSNISHLASIAKLWGERERRLYERGLRQQLVWVMSLQ